MAATDLLRNWASLLLGPSAFAIITATIVAFSLPIILHIYIHHVRPGSVTTLPTFLLLGPSGAGKTGLLTQLERGSGAAATHTSQTPLAVEVSLPVSTVTASSKYRSQNDPTLQTHKRFLVVDTPGHGKLRDHAWEQIKKVKNLKGVIFVVDAANLVSTNSGSIDDGLRDTAEYLHELLLVLTARSFNSKNLKIPKEMAVLVAANKSDLFTALPAPLVKTMLEAEITRVRESRSRGLLDSGIGTRDAGLDLSHDQDRLGDSGQEKFEFSQTRETNVQVDVCRGNVVGPEGPDLDAWWCWIASRL